jgi:Transposase zinc-ribbon domain
MNQVQFQPGLAMSKFFERFRTESQCAQVLERARWSNDFRCPRCQGAAHCLPPATAPALAASI